MRAHLTSLLLLTLPTIVVCCAPDYEETGSQSYQEFIDGKADAPYRGYEDLLALKMIPVGGDPYGAVTIPRTYSYTGNTSSSSLDHIDYYPGHSQDETGPEDVYLMNLEKPARVEAFLAIEPSGTDIDVHLLSSISPLTVVARDDMEVNVNLAAGTYYLVLDSFRGRAGSYRLFLRFRTWDGTTETPGPSDNPPPQTDDAPRFEGKALFNNYILAAVRKLNDGYGGLGYDIDAQLTHDMRYGGHGYIQRTRGARTMCVAAMMEVILKALRIYDEEERQRWVWDYLPKRSWEGGGGSDIRAHLYLMSGTGSSGTADAVQRFGMGIKIPFKVLKPGSFINFSRTSGTGHGVVFLAFIDRDYTEYTQWNANVIGFKYFSAQGGYTSGGFGYRWAVFSGHSLPEKSGYRRDVGVIYSDSSGMLNTGAMWHPADWKDSGSYSSLFSMSTGVDETEGEFDAEFFDGKTIDDDKEW